MISIKKVQKSRDFGLKEYFFKHSPSLQINRWTSVIKEFTSGDVVPPDAMYLGQKMCDEGINFYFLIKNRIPRHITDIENNIVKIYTELSKHSLDMSVEDLDIETVKDLFYTVFISKEEEEWFFSKREVEVNLHELKSVLEIVFKNPEREKNGKLEIKRV